MLSLPAAWDAAYRRSVVTPVVLVVIRLDPKRVVRVYDGTISTGQTIEIGPFILTEGVDFFAGSPNSAVALTIAQGFNDQEDGLPNDAKTGMRAIARGDDVHFVGGARTDEFLGAFAGFPITSSDPAFADEVGTVPTDARFVSGDTPVFGYPCCVTDLATASMSIDPFTRAATIGSIDIEFGDNGQAIRELVRVGYRLYLQRVEVYLGTQNLLEGNFALMGTYVIRDWVPDPGKVVLQCTDFAEDGWKSRTISRNWVARHPLYIVEDMFSAIGASDVIDAATLVSEDYDDISHFVVSRYHDLYFGLNNGITDDRPVPDVLEQLIFMCGGCFIPDNTGIYGYRHFDFNKPISRHWQMGLLGEPGEGYDCDLVETVDSVGKIINRIKSTFAHYDGEGAVNHPIDDVQSFALNDREGYIVFGKLVEETFDLLFCNGYVRIESGTAPAVEGGADNGTTPDSNQRIYEDSTRFSIFMAGRQGFCGARWDWNGSSFDLANGCSLGPNSRYCIVKLMPPGRVVGNVSDPTRIEYIAIAEWILDDDTVFDSISLNVGVPAVPHPNVTRARIAELADGTPALAELGFNLHTVFGRGGLGTSPPGSPSPDAADFWQVQGWPTDPGIIQCVDVTIAVFIAQRLLRRFRYGAPRIRVRTPLEELALELGDFVTISGDDLFIGHQRIGLNTEVVWEIVGKEVDVLADSPGIVWDLVFVYDTGQAFHVPFFDPDDIVLEIDPVAIGLACSDVITTDEPPTTGGEADFLPITTNLIDGQAVAATVFVDATDIDDPTVFAHWEGTGQAERAAGALTINLDDWAKTGSGAITDDPAFVDDGNGQLILHVIGTDSRNIKWHSCIRTTSITGP